MPKLNAVKDPKNGVVSCWVCTGVLVVLEAVRLIKVGWIAPIIDAILFVLIAIWMIISIYQTIKYVKGKKRTGKRA